MELQALKNYCDHQVLHLRFRGGLVFKAHRLVYHSTLGWRVVKRKGVRVRELQALENNRDHQVLHLPRGSDFRGWNVGCMVQGLTGFG